MPANPDPAAPRYRCHTCGVAFKAWAPAQRHTDETRHARVELIMAGAVMGEIEQLRLW